MEEKKKKNSKTDEKLEKVDDIRQNEQPCRWFKIRYLVGFTVLLLFILAIFSFDRGDLSVLEGGTQGPVKNWIGPLGAEISRVLFYCFGLAVYPVLAVFACCLIRWFIPIPRKKVHGYLAGLFAVVLGFTMLLAMWPENYIAETDALGIGRMERSSLALSGGVIGAALAAPPDGENLEMTGLIRRYIGDVGTLVVAAVLLLPGLGVIYYRDWHSVFAALLNRIVDSYAASRKKRREEEEEEQRLEKLHEEEYAR